MNRGCARIVCLAVGLLLAPAAAGASAEETPRPVPAPDSPFEPSVLVSGPKDRTILGEWHERVLGNGNIVAGWITAENTGLGCGYSTSTDGGRSWSKPFFASGMGAGGDPWVAPDLSRPDDVYITCITDPKGDGNLTTWFASSTDGGITWSGWDRGIPWTPVVIDFYALHADNGRLVLTFNEALMDTNAIYSDDGGYTWSKKIDMSTGWPGCVVDDGNGRLFVTSGKRKQNAKWMSSADSGRTWSAPVNIGFLAEGRTDCAVDPRNGDLWLVNPGITNVLVARTSDAGASWKIMNARAGMTARPDFAGIAVDAAGVAHVSWMDERDGSGNGFRAWYVNSTDGGATWSAEMEVSDHKASCDSCQIAHYGHGVVTHPIAGACVGYVADTGGGNEYRHSCARPGAKGVSRIEVSPAFAAITADQTASFAAQAYDAAGRPVPSTPAWSVAGGSIDPQGTYTPGPAGTFEITAAWGGVSGKASVTVTAGALASIEVDPPAAVITAGTVQSFTAAGKDAKGNPVALSPQWSSSGGAIDGSGAFSSVKSGDFVVTASSGGLAGRADVTVIAGTPVSLEVRPAEATVRADGKVDFDAVANDAHGNEVKARASWTLREPGGEASISADGEYVPARTGTFTVAATLGALEARAEVTVTPGRIAAARLEPEEVVLDEGGRVVFEVEAKDSKGNSITDLTFEFEAPASLGRVSPTGDFTALRAGSGKVKATVSDGEASVIAEAKVTVRSDPLAFLKGPLGFAVFALIAAAAAAALLRRRRKRRERETARRAALACQRQNWETGRGWGWDRG